MNEKFAFAGQADIYLRFLDPELDTGFFLCGDINEMTINTESEKKELPSNEKTRKGVLAVLTGKTKHIISLKSKYFDQKTFAMRAGGVAKEEKLAAQTITDELITSVKVGGMYPLAYDNIDETVAVTAKKGDVGPGTPLLADDFEIVDGFVRIKEGGALADGDDLRVTYKTKAVTQVRVKGGKRDKYAVAIKYRGVNIADNDAEFNMEVFRAEISPEGDFSYIGDDFGEASFSGAIIIEDGKDAPYEYIKR